MESVNCKNHFGPLDFYLWPNNTCCFFNNLDLSRKHENSEFKFDVTERQIIKTKTVTFWNCRPLEFIPISILKTFPNLNGFDINGSTIPVLRDGFFSEDLKMIRYLYLGRNKISQIEESTFSTLPELKWICLSGNEIEEIPHRIFKDNPKLEFIDLNKNYIRRIHPKLFEGLKNLKEVWFRRNPIISEDLKKSDGSLQEMDARLKPLFDNYLKKFGVSSGDVDLQQKFERIQLQLAEKDKMFEDLTIKFTKANEDLREANEKLKDLEDGKRDRPALELMDNYAKLRETDGDITLEFADQKSMAAHKTILKAHSLKLAEILSNNSPDIIKMSDFKFEIMEKIFNFIYTGKVDFHPDDAVDLLNYARKLKIPVLKKCLIQQFQVLINISNFLAFYKQAKEDNLEEIKSNILRYFEQNMTDIMKAEVWKEICAEPELLAELLQNSI